MSGVTSGRARREESWEERRSLSARSWWSLERSSSVDAEEGLLALILTGARCSKPMSCGEIMGINGASGGGGSCDDGVFGLSWSVRDSSDQFTRRDATLEESVGLVRDILQSGI